MDQFNPYSSNKQTTQKHHMMMRNRESLDITGVKKIESINKEEFVLETIMGFVSILGENLEMKNVNIDKGEMSINGYVMAIEYLDETPAGQAPNSKSFLSKIFK